MKSMPRLLLLLCLLATPAAPATDLFEFFAEESKVVSASRQPRPLRLAPATVHVVTREDLRLSGAQTLWDALRHVPGIEVMTARTAQGEVSIRGLNKPQNNRTLVLLDGKTVLNSFLDFVTWEEIPVIYDEIDRIEVVEGPASALYGANALNGVINIITRAPEQIGGRQLRLSAGERRALTGSLLYGERRRGTGYKLGLGWRGANQFEDPDRRAAALLKVHGRIDRPLAGDQRLSFSGGVNNYDIQITGAGAASLAANEGTGGYARVDYQRRRTQVRAFWNRNRGVLRGFEPFGDTDMDFDTRDLNLEHALAWGRHELIVGGSYRRNSLRSQPFPGGRVSQDLWALFFENTWQPRAGLTLVGSGRWDRHPLAGQVLSPRLSALYHPGRRHVFRLTAGTSFRNPTLTENYIQILQSYANPGNPLPNPPFTDIDLVFAGNPDLKPERLLFAEAAHRAQWGRLHTSVTGFHYRLRDIITGEVAGIRFEAPRAVIESSFGHEDETRAWGAELEARLNLGDRAECFANYAYQHFAGDVDDLAAEDGGPNHKASGGVRIRAGKAQFNLTGHWVDEALWDTDFLTPDSPNVVLEGYVLLNAALTYALPLRGLEVQVAAFNLADNEHFQAQPARDENFPGYNGEIIRRRANLVVAYSF